MKINMCMRFTMCLIGLIMVVTSVTAEVVYQEDFEAVGNYTPITSLGWEYDSGKVYITHNTPLGARAIDGSTAASGLLNKYYKEIRWPGDGEKLTFTFKAYADGSSYNSGIGIDMRDAGGDEHALLSWGYGGGDQWWFDARGLTGDARDIWPIEANLTNQVLKFEIIMDASGYWVYGKITDSYNNVYNSYVYELPPSYDTGTALLSMYQDRRSGSGPIDIDDLMVTCDRYFADGYPVPTQKHRPLTVVEYSWTTADTKYLHNNIVDMEERPLDGVCTRVADPRYPYGNLLNGTGLGDAGWKVFQNTALTRSVIEPAIEDLQTTPFSKFRSNYVVIVSYLAGDGETLDWYDDSWWANIVNNAGLMAEVAKEGGCEGIMFDPEEYGCNIWGWPQLSGDPRYAGKTYEQTRQKIRQRGQEFMTAINASFPGVRIFILHAWEDALSVVADDFGRLKDFSRGYIVAFLDGMLEASDANTVLVDGIERGYYIEELEEFRNKVKRVKRYGPLVSEVPELFNAKVQTGFGIYFDRNQRWSPDDFTNNYWQPDGIEKVITNALMASDGFVWVYSERATWWLDSATDTLGDGITLGTGEGNHAWRNTEIKYIPHDYWYPVWRAKRNAQMYFDGKDFTGDESKTGVELGFTPAWDSVTAGKVVDYTGQSWYPMDGESLLIPNTDSGSVGACAVLDISGNDAIKELSIQLEMGLLYTTSISGAEAAIFSKSGQLVMRVYLNSGYWKFQRWDTAGNDLGSMSIDAPLNPPEPHVKAAFVLDKRLGEYYADVTWDGGSFVSPKTDVNEADFEDIFDKLKLYGDTRYTVAGKAVYDNIVVYKENGPIPDTCWQVWMYGYGMAKDIDHNCKIDLYDLAIFMEDWLRCNNPEQSGCEKVLP